MAAGVVRLGDVVVPAIFDPYVQKLTEEKTAFLASGIVQRSPQLDRWLQGGGMTLNMPTWKDLDNDTPKTATDAAAPDQGVLLGMGAGGAGTGASIAPNKVGTYNELAIRITRTQQWAANKLQDYLSGSDAMAHIADRVSTYESRFLQKQILAELAGVFAGNVLNNSGDMSFDASGVGFVAGVTNFTAENLFDALQTAGDSQNDFSVLSVHSAVYNRMRKNNLIDFIPDSETGASLATFQGLRLVVDDGMPKTGNVYTSYIFAPGALEIGWATLEKPSEVYWLPDAGQGIGAEILFRRWSNSIHPMGFAYAGSAANSGGPTDITLALAASWTRACPERKQVKMAQLITREA